MSKLLTPDDAAKLLSWYRKNKRCLPWRDTNNPEDVWISEIMLQQTRVEAVKAYFVRFRTALPTVSSIASCEDDRLMKLWEGLGYYSRAKNLKKCAQVLQERYNGTLPSDPEKLKQLPGIGSYTAGAIASIAYNVPVPAVDGNVLRVFARLTGNDSDITLTKTKQHVTEMLQTLLWDCSAAAWSHTGGTRSFFSTSDFNQALMELGAVVCIPNGAALCTRCPLSDCCEARKTGQVERLPIRSPKKKRKIEPRTLLIIRDGERFLFQKRPSKGLLAGLYEFPGLPGTLDEESALQGAKQLGFTPLRIRPLPGGIHVFTHMEWHMTAWEIQVAEFPAESLVSEASPTSASDALLPQPASDALLPRPASDTLPPRPASDTLPPQPASDTLPPQPASPGSPDSPAGVRSGSRILIRKEELSHVAVPAAFRTWIQWYALNA